MRTRVGRFKAWRGFLAAGVAVLALSVGLARPAGAASRFVATTGNDSSNTCLASGSPCKTITRALTQAVANDTISVAAGTYNTALGETFPLTINKNLTLTGAGAGSTTIDATGANQRVITISSGTVTISGMTITGGATSCTASGCFSGGGLGNFGTLTLTNSTVSGNTAMCTSSGSTGCEIGGGGLSNFGTLTLTNSTVSGNTASCTNTGSACNAFGGGLRNDGTMTVTNTTVTANTVTCSGAGCTAESGGLWNEGSLTVTASTVSGNTANCNASGSDSCDAPGGGVFNGFGGTMTVTASTVSGNTASCTTTGSGACIAFGGGLLNTGDPGSTLTLTNSTVSGNTANCTKTGSGPCSALGGGLANARALTVTNATVTANSATCSGAGCTAAGGGFDNAAGTTTLKNTIVAKQLAGADCANSGTITSNGFNLDSDNTCHLTQPSDKPNVSDPLLGPLQDNGGQTETHALLPGSPAIDAASPDCPPPATDQRGVTRPQGPACDIGAYEFGTPVTSVTLSATPSSPQPLGTPILWTAAATGGTAPEFEFWVQPSGGAWTLGQAYSASNTWNWTPSTAGDYVVCVWARSNGSSAAFEAFDCEAFRVTAGGGAVTSVTLSATPPSPQPLGTPILWTATATGGIAPQFRFWVQAQGGPFTLARDYSSSNTFAWTPSTAGDYTVCAWARSTGASAAFEAFDCKAFRVTPGGGPVTAVTLVATPSSPQPLGTPITWTATATGGTAPQYQFWVQPTGGAWTLGQAYSSANTFLWTPSTAGDYTVCAWARSTGASAAWEAFDCKAFRVTPGGGAVTSVTLSATPPSPQPVNTPILWTATATGGTAPQLQFWWQPAGGSWTLGQAYSTINTWTGTPSTAGDYTVCAWARSTGSSATWEAFDCKGFQVR